MSFREKVKGILEAKTVTMAHPESQKAGTQGPEGAIKVSKEEVKKYVAKGWKPVEKSKPKPTNEDSNHPFYQKVKALSRGNKSQSILEKKSKTIKLLIGRIKPMKEAKEDEETKIEVERQRRMQQYGTEDVKGLEPLPPRKREPKKDTGGTGMGLWGTKRNKKD